MARRFAAVCALIIVLGTALVSGEKIDESVNGKIRQEETAHSEVMHLAHMLTDIHGPRVTGTPPFRAAGEWALGELGQWGLDARIEKWEFGHYGWAPERHFVRVLSPYRSVLAAGVVAWTPGTKGAVRAPVIEITPPERPAPEELAAYLDGVRDQVRGRIVMVGAHRVLPISFSAEPKRREESDLLSQYDPARLPLRPPAASAGDGRLEPYEAEQSIDAFLLSSGALVKVKEAAAAGGELRVAANRTLDCSRALPGIVLRNEDYGRIARVLADGLPVEMEVEIVNDVYPEGTVSGNVVAEIPGSDKRDEIVMMGAHMDSWHAGTGATDNAAGVAVMMEAARVLQKIFAAPRRTIRIVLWGGEEQGLLGSRAYVRDHFGTFESPGPEYSRLSAYLNLDSGTGRVRGATVFGPPAAAAVLRQILAPFADLGVVGCNATSVRRHGETDSTSFGWAGLPAVSLSQDPIDYEARTWHTDLDTYESLLETDLKQCAMVVASAAYHLAMREARLPRFEAGEMPRAEP